jgi:hypothetical protein
VRAGAAAAERWVGEQRALFKGRWVIAFLRSRQQAHLSLRVCVFGDRRGNRLGCPEAC